MNLHMPGGRTATQRRLPGRPIRLLLALLTLVAPGTAGTHHGHGRHVPPAPIASTSGRPTATPRPIPAVEIPEAVLRDLPLATTDGRLPAAPTDHTPYAGTTGTVAHPRRTVPVYTAPGGLAVAALPATQVGGSPTWVPVTATRPGWLAVLLPTRPNHATGWITTTGVERAHTDYTITVALGAHRLTLHRRGKPVGTWPTSDGTPATPTPTGRTFLLAEIDETRTHYSPVIWPLGAHSASLDSFGGGPGTVAIHGWPDPAVFGHDRSSGCVRIPAVGLHALATVPLGSLVTITH